MRLRPPPGQKPDPAAPQDWAADIRNRLARGDLGYEMQLPFFADEETTPIEDPPTLWPESETPYHTVARLIIPSVQPSNTDGFSARVNSAGFLLGNALASHRPRGEVNRARGRDGPECRESAGNPLRGGNDPAFSVTVRQLLLSA